MAGENDRPTDPLQEAAQWLDGLGEEQRLVLAMMKQDDFDAELPRERIDVLAHAMMQTLRDRPGIEFSVSPYSPTKMIPLYGVPLLFCGHADDEKRSRCLIEWANDVAMTALYGELVACDPDTWRACFSRSDVSPLSVVALDELQQWALSEFGLPISTDSIVMPVSPRAGPRNMRDNTLIRVIAALLCKWPGGRNRWPSGKDLEAAAQRAGISVSDDSITHAIKMAAEEIENHPPK